MWLNIIVFLDRVVERVLPVGEEVLVLFAHMVLFNRFYIIMN